ncbi:MAG: hypothetical protein ABSH48_06235 [Verrucomicrobiota bacterium]
MPPPPFSARLKNLGRVFFLSVLASFNPSVLGQGNPLYVWRTLTGEPGGAGNANGAGSAARFFDPSGVAVDGAGNIYVADSGNNIIRKVTPDGVVMTLAGSVGVFGSADGTNTTALFDNPSGVAVDSAGNVYVADTYNCTIRRVTPGGVVTTLAGNAGQPGSADGTNDTALFNFPRGVAVDGVGNVYVADSGNNTIRKVTTNGVVTTLAGKAGQSGSADGTGSGALFFYPAGVAVDDAGHLYVADLNNNTIRKVTPLGAVTTLAGLPQFDHFGTPIGGSADGTGTNALFDYPSGLGVDSLGNVYVADTGNSTIRQITTNGVVTTLAGSAGQVGVVDGTNSAAYFDYPYDVAVAGNGRLYVADSGNDAIRLVTTNGVVTTVAGSGEQSGSVDVTGGSVRFNFPAGVAVVGGGNIYVADTRNDTIRMMTTNGVVSTVAGSAGLAGSTDGTNGAARFNNPAGVALDGAGNLYVADTGNNTIRMVSSRGVVTTLAGSAGLAGSADGTNGTARFDNPEGLALDGAGNLYVADSGNNTIRKVTGAGVVTTVAGSAGLAGSADGTNGTARFNNPAGVAVDGLADLFVADAGNKTIRQITGDGVVTTLAGSAGLAGSTDGTNSIARFSYPFGLTVDSSNNLYVADTVNCTIREVTTNGVVTTLAGSPGQPGSMDGTGSAARFLAPTGLASASAGIVYVADAGNSTLRKISSGGVVTTLAGSAGQVGSADDVSSAARYFLPAGVAVDGAGNVYVADTGNSTIRKVTTDGGVSTIAGSAGLTGATDDSNGVALFDYPSGVAVDNADNLYVADTFNSAIRKVTAAGVVTTLAGSLGQSGSADGPNSAALFNYPSGVAVDSAGNVYVADTGNDTIRKVTSGGTVTTLAGSAGLSGSADGTSSAALFSSPRGVAVDSAGNAYVADSGNDTIRKVTSGGIVTTIGGTADVIGGADGIGTLAGFAGPVGLAVDGGGRIYVADTGNNRISTGTPMPVMSLTSSALGVIVSWPAPFTDFVLQQNSNLDNPGGWSTPSFQISDDGTNKSIIISPSTGNQFFRLMAN